MSITIPPVDSRDPLSVRAMSLAVLALLVMAGTWALCIVAIRGPMGPSLSLPGLKAFLLTGAVMLTWHEGARRLLEDRWSSYAWVLLATLAVMFLPALPWLLGQPAVPVLHVLLALVWAVGLRGLFAGCRTHRPGHIAAAVVSGVALGAAYFVYVNTKGYGTVFSPEQTLLGTQHRDTLYHASIAAMLGAFGVPSTGLDGLVRVNYHFLSHALIGWTGRWMGLTPIHAYYLTNQVFNLPLLLFSVTAASFWLWRPGRAVAGGLLTLLVPLLGLMVFEIWEWGSYLVSESFSLSLVLLLLTLPLVIELHERPRIRRAMVRYAVLAVAGMAIVLAKNSVGALFAGSVVFVTLRGQGFTLRRLAATVVVVTVLLGAGMWVTAPVGYSGQSMIGPLHFFRTYPTSAWPNFWAIVLGLALGAWRWRSSPDVRVPIEVLAVLALGSLCLGMVLQLGSGAAYYFMNVGVWVAFVLASSALLPWLAALPRQGAVAGVLGVVVIGAIAAQPDKRRAPANLVTLATVVAAQAEGAELPATGPRPLVHTLLRSSDTLRPRIAAAVPLTPGGRMHARLMRAASADVDAVYVPPANVAFWRLSKIVCTAQPFFVPAVSSLPLILGLPPDPGECPLPADTGYGYGAYQERSRSVALADPDLCVILRQRGFQTVLVLESPDADRVLRCP